MNANLLLTGDKTTTLESIYERAQVIHNRCEDVMLDFFSTARVENDGAYGKLNFVAPFSSDAYTKDADGNVAVLGLPVSAKLTPWSFKQLCGARLGVPHVFMKKCIDSKSLQKKALFERTVNTFISEYDRGVRVRLYKSEDGPIVRGILTPTYSVFDTLDVLKTVKETLEKNTGINFHIKGHFVDETGLQLRFVSDEPLAVEGEEDDLYAGFIVSTGDVGNRKLSVRFFIWKQICTNGLVAAKGIGDMLNKHHRGSFDSDLRDSLAQTIAMLPEFAANATEVIKASKGKQLSYDEVTALLGSFEKNVKLTEAEKEKIISLSFDRYGSGAKTSRWGFINALTEFAQEERFDVDDRTDIEEYAGVLLFRGAHAA